jgi:hypothetical protein
LVRTGPNDPGRITEFKTLESPSSSAVKNNIVDAGHQSKEASVIDGRNVGLTEENARRGYARAVGQARAHGQTIPESVRIILGDNRIITLP